tara:strand:+ start:5616 stop:6119 length:504 start_codon:yes stop_codon:yes gene_type:complete
MKIDNFLHLLVKNEKTWLSMAEEITSSSRINSKDLLHDFYIAIHSKVESRKVKTQDIMHNDSFNKSFVYRMMSNIFYDIIRKDKDIYIDKEMKRVLKANNTPYVDYDKIIDDIVNEFYWFDKKLFNLYRRKFHSIRKLSAATNISHVVVWKTINNCMKILKKKINEK